MSAWAATGEGSGHLCQQVASTCMELEIKAEWMNMTWPAISSNEWSSWLHWVESVTSGLVALLLNSLVLLPTIQTPQILCQKPLVTQHILHIPEPSIFSRALQQLSDCDVILLFISDCQPSRSTMFRVLSKTRCLEPSMM